MLHLLQGISEANGILLEENDISIALNKVVEILGLSTDVDRCYIFTNKLVNDEWCKFYTHEWCNEGIPAQISNKKLVNLSYKLLPELYSTLSQNKYIYGNIKESNNKFFKELMESKNVFSYLFAPIFCNNEFWGYLGFDDCTNENSWKEEEITSLIAVARNIGLRLANSIAEKAREKQIERFEMAVIASRQGLWEWYIPQNKFYYSDLYMEMIGYAPNEFEHNLENFKNLMYPGDWEKCINIMNEYLSRKIPFYNVDFRLKHKDGSYKWVHDSGVAKWNENDIPTYMVGSHRDITELKEQQEFLELQKNEIDHLLNSLGEAVFKLNIDNKITFVNDFWEEIAGYSIDESISSPFESFFLPDDLPEILHAINNLRNNSFIKSSLEVHLIQKNGEWRWVELLFRENKTGIAEDVFIAGSIIDIHDKKIGAERERELAELKAGFVSLTSHQFRTPLTAIFSNVEVIELTAKKFEPKLLKTVNNAAEKIKEQINRMTQLMDNILLVGRYDAKQLLYNLQPYDIKEMIQSVINTYFINQLDGRKINYIGVDGSRKVMLDEMLFMHVLTNIISNAFKYSVGFDGPELHLFHHENYLEIIVKDFGIGVPQEELNKVFNSFYRASNTITYQGSGLGLAVAKQFMELMKGSIKLESTLGKGTNVILTLPYADE